MKYLKGLVISVSLLSSTMITACGFNSSKGSSSKIEDFSAEIMEIEMRTLMQNHTGIFFETTLRKGSATESKSFYFKKLQDDEFGECYLHKSGNKDLDNGTIDYFIGEYLIHYFYEPEASKINQNEGFALFAVFSPIARILDYPTSVYTTSKREAPNGNIIYRLDFSNYKDIVATYVDYEVLPKSFGITTTVNNGFILTSQISFVFDTITFTGVFTYDYEPYPQPIPKQVRDAYKEVSHSN